VLAASISLILFALFHFSFLVLNFEYQGGVANLVGGALIMGILWYFIAIKTGTIKYGIFAHQLVNAMAFSSLFVLNGI
jgi:membrane protease YdiL (CAAX protease family)